MVGIVVFLAGCVAGRGKIARSGRAVDDEAVWRRQPDRDSTGLVGVAQG